jgi:AbrB family looped-hinge helix DNA binding protein
MADLVRIKDKFQLTIPVALRRQLAVQEGDYLEASVTQDGILFRPQTLVSTGAMVPRKPSLLDFLKEPRPYKRTRQQIDAALKADRDSWDK